MPRAFFYVQHLLGIGHLTRASRIASALKAEGFEVTMAVGGMRVQGFPGPDVTPVILPPVKASDEAFTALIDDTGREVDEAFKARRRDQLLAAFDAADPDVLVTEAFPFARRKLRFELLPLMEAATARRKRPLIASSIRDILQESAKPHHATNSVDLVKRYFDVVLVHGDPGFARLEESFPLATEIASKLVYTGLVAPPPVPAGEKFDAVVSCGGGATGTRILLTAAEAMHNLLDTLPRWCFIAGPNLPGESAAKLRASIAGRAEIHTFRSDFPALLKAATVSCSLGGYNTVCDLMRAGCRMVLIPFAGKEETEQRMRAERLTRLGLAQMISERVLDPANLTEAIKAALAAPAPNHRVDLDGAAHSARILRERVARGAGLAAS